MRLKALTIKNFKGIDEHGIRIELAPISLLFGPNNAGKSTILQALHLARVIICHPKSNINKIDALGNVLNIGSFEDYVHLHDKDRVVTIGLELSADKLSQIDLLKRKLHDFSLFEPIMALFKTTKEQQSELPVVFDEPELGIAKIQEFIDTFDALAAAVEQAAGHVFGPIDKESLTAKLEILKDIHNGAVSAAKQTKKEFARERQAIDRKEFEIDYSEALKATNQYTDNLIKHITSGENALKERQKELYELLEPLIESTERSGSDDLSAMNFDSLKLQVEEIMTILNAVINPVTQSIEAVLPFMPLEQQKFGMKHLKRHYDTAVIAMGQLAEEMSGAFVSSTHELQAPEIGFVETHFKNIMDAVIMFTTTALDFVHEKIIYAPTTVDISIRFDKELNATKYDFSSTFSSTYYSFNREYSELSKNIDRELFRISKNIGLPKYMLIHTMNAVIKLYDYIEYGCKKFASAASAKVPALKAPLEIFGKCISAIQVDGTSFIKAGNFFKNKFNLNKFGNSLIQSGELIIAEEAFEKLDAKEKYFTRITELDHAIQDGNDTQTHEREAYSSLLRWIQEFIEHSIYIGPLRSIPRRGAAKISQMQYADWAEGSAAWDKLRFATEEQIDTINSAMHGPGSLETGYTVQLGSTSKNKRLFLQNERSKIVVEPHDMGTGISQILPVVTAAVLEQNTLIMVAQPELHIHPKLQANLGDTFIKAAQNNGSIFLLETHSEHLLLRLLKRIRHTHAGKAHGGLSFRHTDLSVNWIGNEDGHTHALRLEVDDDGSFNTPWPEGFFDERGEELFG